MRRTPVLGSLFAITLALGVGACGGGGSDSDDLKDDLIEGFQSDAGFTAEQAKCAAGVLLDEVGEDELKDIDFSADAPAEEQAEIYAKAGQRIVADCDVDLGE